MLSSSRLRSSFSWSPRLRKRTALPFDLPEAETELVGGYHTEYSSMKFALFFLGEYANMIAVVGDDGDVVFRRLDAAVLRVWIMPAQVTGHGRRCTSLIFLAKMLFFMVVFIWVRWMWPRFRYDQLMDLGWRRFLPLALVNILVTAVLGCGCKRMPHMAVNSNDC